MKDLEKVLIPSAEALRSWREEHHTQTESVWLVKWKKDTGKPYLSRLKSRTVRFGFYFYTKH